ncbi:hypothetical protein FJZ41_02870, partial [Candidatus Shapirobacteria bacterium]|nr:hypothetical protein [Candidatus Shapirobacteria bacterium]
MTVEIKFKVLLLLFILAFFLKIIIFPPSAQAAVVNAKSYKIIVSAAIGEPKLTLWGYSSPNSLVQLQGERVAEETIAQSDGYFLFDRIFLPLPNPDYPELCLSAIDTQSRISFPVCLPPLPVGLFDLSVGPVLLPPTISLEKGFFLPKEQISAEGLTIPNTQVNIFLANEISRKKT